MAGRERAGVELALARGALGAPAGTSSAAGERLRGLAAGYCRTSAAFRAAKGGEAIPSTWDCPAPGLQSPGGAGRPRRCIRSWSRPATGRTPDPASPSRPPPGALEDHDDEAAAAGVRSRASRSPRRPRSRCRASTVQGSSSPARRNFRSRPRRWIAARELQVMHDLDRRGGGPPRYERGEMATANSGAALTSSGSLLVLTEIRSRAAGMHPVAQKSSNFEGDEWRGER
jgi:hypothetical protein